MQWEGLDFHLTIFFCAVKNILGDSTVLKRHEAEFTASIRFLSCLHDAARPKNNGKDLGIRSLIRVARCTYISRYTATNPAETDLLSIARNSIKSKQNTWHSPFYIRCSIILPFQLLLVFLFSNFKLPVLQAVSKCLNTAMHLEIFLFCYLIMWKC